MAPSPAASSRSDQRSWSGLGSGASRLLPSQSPSAQRGRRSYVGTSGPPPESLLSALDDGVPGQPKARAFSPGLQELLRNTPSVASDDEMPDATTAFSQLPPSKNPSLKNKSRPRKFQGHSQDSSSPESHPNHGTTRGTAPALEPFPMDSLPPPATSSPPRRPISRNPDKRSR